MKITKANPKTPESTIALRDTKSGDVIRFSHDSFEAAIKSDSFFMRIEMPELKGDRFRLINISDGKSIERDGEHRVIVHNTLLHIDSK